MTTLPKVKADKMCVHAGLTDALSQALIEFNYATRAAVLAPDDEEAGVALVVAWQRLVGAIVSPVRNPTPIVLTAQRKMGGHPAHPIAAPEAIEPK